MAQDYNKTLNLPKTDLAMRANLPNREQDAFKENDKKQLYENIIAKNEGKPLYVLHDGPPYANGAIHLGTAMNKVLKDFIVKQKNMNGFQSPFVPGWDTHGLPIELKVLKSLSAEERATITPIELRKYCYNYALDFVENQKRQFKSLGVIGDYEHPYLTLKPEFEAKQIEIFGAMANKGYIYKGLKPVYWCPECNTALAEAEIEYEDDPCYSIYVKFPVLEDKGIFEKIGVDKGQVYFVIWTTTTWTLPGNVAVCLGPNYDYTLVKVKDKYYVMAVDLVASTMAVAGITDYETVGAFKGADLEYIKTAHPFYDRTSLVIIGDHVTLESGTGCVHTAPGHGVEDFEVAKNYDELEIIVPVDNKGYMTDEALQFAGLSTDEANKAITKSLEESHLLFALQKIAHQYPHCWRCHSPILFRATEQWFCSVEDFKNETIDAISNVKWIPSWGEERIKGMVRDRSDWCISRQRTWGVPIPILYCEDCGEIIVNEMTIAAVAEMFRKEGADSWYIKEPKEFVPESVACPKCQSRNFRKETDIMDVWFDSGVSHAAVLEEIGLPVPTDLYLEGHDQFRGWFQSSLLTSVAYRGTAPYKSVCSCGMVVDGDGKKMSKSLGNGIEPAELTSKYGADILRLWVASSDYHNDVRISDDILKQLSEGYRKIRNTARFILGNLNDFDPDKDAVSYEQFTELDKWAISKLDQVIVKVDKAYEDFEFHIVYNTIRNFCVIDMSNFYLDVLKDRLYCEKTDSSARRAAQTAIYEILCAIVRMMAPILAFTSEEIWDKMPHKKADNKGSVLYSDMPKASGLKLEQSFFDKWDFIYSIREDVTKALEVKRAEKYIGSSLEATIVLYCQGDLMKSILQYKEDLKTIFIVSGVEIQEDISGEFKGETEGLSITVKKASGDKCERCWTYSGTVGKDNHHPTLCSRCVNVLK